MKYFKYLLICFIICATFFFVDTLTPKALVDGCITSGTSLRGSSYLGSRVVGSNYYYEFASGTYDSSPLNVDFCTEWQMNSPASGTKKVNFVVEYCVNGAPPTLEIWSSYYNTVDYTYFTGKSIYLTDGEWSRAQCYRSFVSLNLNYEDSIGTSGLYNYTRFTDNNNTFAMIANYGYNVLLRYTDLIYYNSNDYNNLLLQTKEEVNSQTQINQNQQIIQGQDEIKDSLTSEDGPSKLDALENSAGWLPAGPVDSILNLPLSLLNNLSANLGKSCQPVTLPLPFGVGNITLPCLSTIYSQIEGLSTWINTISLIAAAFILYSYLLKLYAWVDGVITMRENTWNDADQWGGL